MAFRRSYLPNIWFDEIGDSNCHEATCRREKRTRKAICHLTLLGTVHVSLSSNQESIVELSHLTITLVDPLIQSDIAGYITKCHVPIFYHYHQDLLFRRALRS